MASGIARLLVAVLLVSTVALAGCGSKDKTEDPTTTTPTDTTPTGTTPTGTTPTGTTPTKPTATTPTKPTSPTTPGNHAPSAILVADVTEGAAPLEVQFSISGTDSDNDVLTFSLDADNDGEEDASGTVPGDATITFSTAGTYEATVTVSDGKATDTAFIEIVVSEATAPPAPEHFEDSVMCPPNPGAPVYVLPGTDHTFTVPSGVSVMTVTLTYDDASGIGITDLDLAIVDAAGTETNSEAAGPEPPVVFEGPAPGDWTVTVNGFSCILTASYTLDVTYL